MKIFQLVNNPHSNFANPYVSTLMNGISEIDKTIVWGYGIDNFWKDEIFQFDIIHIHWPHYIVQFCSKRDITLDYKQRLLNLKAKGIKIIVTCHNIEPHYEKDFRKIQAYRITYEQADCILHLGEYSLNFLRNKYPNAKHVLLPHHTYDTEYKVVSKEDSLNRLCLSPSQKYILCFGDFRDDEERQLIDNVLKHYYTQGIEIIAPHYYKYINRRNKIKMLTSWLKSKLKTLSTKGLHIYGKYVTNEMLPYFYGAADICLIQRKRILNSGNLPMAFYMGKVVVGPNVGNVGEILTKTDNPVFNTDDLDSLFVAINKAFSLCDMGKGSDNKEYAMTFLSTEKISEMLYQIYREIL